MGKSVILLSFIGIAILLVGSLLFPNSSAFWLANTSPGFAVIRFMLLVALGLLLATNPPRNIYLRLGIGAFAGAAGLWAIVATYTNAMQLLDTLSVLAASISSGIAVLEYIPDEDEESTVKSTATKAHA